MSFKAAAEAALESRAKLVTELRSMNDDKTLTDADKEARAAKLNADITSLEAEARAAVEDGEREARATELFERAGKLTLPANTDGSGARSEAQDLDEHFRNVGLGESRGFDIVTTGQLRAAAGANTAKLTDSAWAGTTVQNKFVAEVLQSLIEYSPILQAGVRIITTSTGEKMEWPFKNGRIAASRVDEGQVYPRSKDTFTRFGLDSFKYGVIAEATNEMLRDSQLNLAAIVAQDMGESLGIKTALDFLKGSGTNEPFGLLPSTVLTSPIANAAAYSTDALVTLQHGVTPRYRANGKWYMSDDAVLKARLLKDNQGRYIWQDALNSGAPDTMLGKPVIVDVNMDSVAATKSPVLFGDFSKFIVRFVGAVQVTQSLEYGWDSDVHAWKGTVHADSGQSDAASVVKLVVTA